MLMTQNLKFFAGDDTDGKSELTVSQFKIQLTEVTKAIVHPNFPCRKYQQFGLLITTVHSCRTFSFIEKISTKFRER